MMENAVYSVISPEGCAAILWKDAAKADLAAAALKLTADRLNQFGLIDGIVTEKTEWNIDGESSDGGLGFTAVADSLKKTLLENLKELKTKTGDQLVKERYKKFRAMGRWA